MGKMKKGTVLVLLLFAVVFAAAACAAPDKTDDSESVSAAPAEADETDESETEQETQEAEEETTVDMELIEQTEAADIDKLDELYHMLHSYGGTIGTSGWVINSDVCLGYVGITLFNPEKGYVTTSDSWTYAEVYGTYEETYTPVAGDIIMFCEGDGSDLKSPHTHVSIVVEDYDSETGTYTTIDGSNESLLYETTVELRVRDYGDDDERLEVYIWHCSDETVRNRLVSNAYSLLETYQADEYGFKVAYYSLNISGGMCFVVLVNIMLME